LLQTLLLLLAVLQSAPLTALLLPQLLLLLLLPQPCPSAVHSRMSNTRSLPTAAAQRRSLPLLLLVLLQGTDPHAAAEAAQQ
jgi:hypothetical protein